MKRDGFWYVFGPSAICLALGRRGPRTADVYFSGVRPDRRDVCKLFAYGDVLQIRYSTVEPDHVINLDELKIIPTGSTFVVRDSNLGLENREVKVLNYDINVSESIRISKMMALFSDFNWPLHLREKVNSDVGYARIVAQTEQNFEIFLENTDFDFLIDS